MKVIISYTLCKPDKTALWAGRRGLVMLCEKNVDCAIEDRKGWGKCNEHDFANLSVGQRMYQVISVVGLPIWVTTHETRPLPRLWGEITSMLMPPIDSLYSFWKVMSFSVQQHVRDQINCAYSSCYISNRIWTHENITSWRWGPICDWRRWQLPIKNRSIFIVHMPLELLWLPSHAAAVFHVYWILSLLGLMEIA
jgi:hypothetical protein